METDLRLPAAEHVLVMVDDDYDDFILTRRAFESVCNVKEFNCAQSGSALFAYLNGSADADADGDRLRPSLILMDINMPEENGLEVLRKLRGMPEYRHIPVVMLSTSSSEADVTAAYQCGANSFLRKPSSLAELKQIAERFSDYWFKTTKLPPFL